MSIYIKEERPNMNKTSIILLATMACGLIISLMYIGRLAAKLSHMENAVNMMDAKLCASDE